MMKIGIVGCGKIAEKHLVAYKKIGNNEVLISDLDREKARDMGEKYGVDWNGNPESLIGSSEIDVIDVCVPTPKHSDIISKALDNEKHVFCEKPLVSNLEEAKEIRKKASESDQVVMSGYLYRFHSAFKLAKEALDEGIIGDPYYAIFRVGGRGSHREWKHQRERGGGATNEMLVHMLNLITWYFDGIKSVENLSVETIMETRDIQGNEVEVDAEDVVILKLDTEKGTRVLCESDLITPSYMNYIEIQGTNGSIWASILDYFPAIVYCKEARGVYNQGNNFFRFSREDLFEKELSYFLDTVQNDKSPSLNSIDDSLEIQSIIDSIRNPQGSS